MSGDQIPTTDLIEQLRAQAVLVAQGHGGTAESQSMLAAADEIERLLRNVGCARHQHTTQFCAEVPAAHTRGWNEAAEAAAGIVSEARSFERDSDLRSIIHAIQALRKDEQ